MKKFSLLLLVAAATAYAAENALVLSDTIIGLGDAVIKAAWHRAEKQAGELTGTVSEMYRYLLEVGYKEAMQENPAAVARAAEIFAFLTDKNSENDDVKLAVAAFEAAQAIAPDAAVEAKLQAWQNEYKAFSVALIRLLKQNTPEGLVIHPLTTERIVLNNGKKFSEESLIEVIAGSFAVLAGFERRKAEMGNEMFMQFCDGLLQNSPAHQAVSTIAIPESR